MHKIYFEKRCIIICGEDDALLTDPNSIEFRLEKDIDIKKLLNIIEASATLCKIIIPTSRIEYVYRRICLEFKEVEAAGGLVSNRREDFLLINRNNLWDLPKGHREPGEDIKICAIREVREETGVQELKCNDLICITDHCYKRDGIWHLKHTYWFDMLYTGPIDLKPQTEEDITKATWVPRSCISTYLTNTYPSIVEVFRHYTYYFQKAPFTK